MNEIECMLHRFRLQDILSTMMEEISAMNSDGDEHSAGIAETLNCAIDIYGQEVTPAELFEHNIIFSSTIAEKIHNRLLRDHEFDVLAKTILKYANSIEPAEFKEASEFQRNVQIDPKNSYKSIRPTKVDFPMGALFHYSTPVIDRYLCVPRFSMFLDHHTYHCLYDMRNASTYLAVTPNIIFLNRKPIRRAHGKVLLLGLQNFYFAYESAKKNSVEKVTIVEKSSNLSNYFTSFILPQFPKSMQDKIELIIEDPREYVVREDLVSDNIPLYDFIYLNTYRDQFNGAEEYLFFKTIFNVHAKGLSTENGKSEDLEIEKSADINKYLPFEVHYFMEDGILAYLVSEIFRDELTYAFSQAVNTPNAKKFDIEAYKEKISERSSELIKIAEIVEKRIQNTRFDEPQDLLRFYSYKTMASIINEYSFSI